MLGWSIRARACRSASKRAITWRVSMPSLMILRATLRRMGSCLLGHVDHRHAAFADLLQQLVPADDRTGTLQQRGSGRTDRRVLEHGLIEQGLRNRATCSSASTSACSLASVPAGLDHVRTPLYGVLILQGRLENCLFIAARMA